MVRIINGKLYLGGVFFELPHGFCIDPFPVPVFHNEDGVSFVLPELNCRLRIDAYECSADARRELKNYYNINDFTFIEKYRTLRMNGMRGAEAVYCDENYSYYEVQLDMPKNKEGLNILAFLVIMEGTDAPIVKVAHSQAIQNVLQNIMPVAAVRKNKRKNIRRFAYKAKK